MGEITIISYDSCDKFKTNSPRGVKPLSLTMQELISYAISAGGFSNRAVGEKGQAFYAALVEMALNEGTTFTIGSDYKQSETSIKTSISFFMGMIAAKAVADKKYGIKYLYHLKDPRICFSTTGKTPDFFGLINGTDAGLFEAKGTTGKKPQNKIVEGAKNQLNAIKSVELVSSTTSCTKHTTFSKHIIASCFNNKDEWTYLDIDPNETGDTELTINIDHAIILYYQNIMSLLGKKCTTEQATKQTTEQTTEQTTGLTIIVDENYVVKNYVVKNYVVKNYVVKKLGNYSVGLHKKIYDKLSNDKLFPIYESLFEEKEFTLNNSDSFKGLYDSIDKITNSLPESSDPRYALRSDGIICFYHNEDERQ